VGYQLKDYTDYIVGSEETEPGDGYTYDTMLGPLVTQPDMSARDFAAVTVKSYADHYVGGNGGATQSAIESSTLPQLRTLLDNWVQAVMAAGELKTVKSAQEQTQRFYYGDNKDLLHFVKLVDAATQQQTVKSQGALLEDFLANHVLVSNAAVGSSMANAKGLAIYLPDSGYNSDYDALNWAQGGSWPKFVQWILRAPAPQPEEPPIRIRDDR